MARLYRMKMVMWFFKAASRFEKTYPTEGPYRQESDPYVPIAPTAFYSPMSCQVTETAQSILTVER